MTIDQFLRCMARRDVANRFWIVERSPGDAVGGAGSQAAGWGARPAGAWLLALARNRALNVLRDAERASAAETVMGLLKNEAVAAGSRSARDRCGNWPTWNG